jgi:hypothetical protein
MRSHYRHTSAGRIASSLHADVIFGKDNGRRQILWLGVTAHPTAEWIANQLTEACGWDQFPAILSVISMGPMVRSSSEEFDPWTFVIDRRRRAPHRKTDLLNG